MKKIIAIAVTAIALTGCVDPRLMAGKNAGTYTVNMQQLQQEAICQSNAAVFYPECNTNRTDTIYCKADITEEASGKINRGVSFNLDSTEKYTKQGNNRVYHEEDETGSTTVYIDEDTGKGSITMMDESQVTHTGNVFCHK